MTAQRHPTNRVKRSDSPIVQAPNANGQVAQPSYVASSLTRRACLLHREGSKRLASKLADSSSVESDGKS